MALQYTAPNAPLARELRQVAVSADRVTEVLRGINHLPANFPFAALSELCAAMTHLQFGTGEGCNMPLTYARHALPLWRKENFYIEGELPEGLAEDAANFLRGQPLDVALLNLYGAVGTALDEYRAQAQAEYDDRVGPEDTIDLGRGDVFRDIDTRSRTVVQQADQAGQDFASLDPPKTKATDDYARLLQDGANAGHTVQSQIQTRPLIARFYKAAATAVAKIPGALDKAGNLIITSTDIAQIWVEGFSAFNKRIRYGVYDSIRDLGTALKATGARLKQAQGAGQPTARQDDPDMAAAEALVEKMLRNGTPVPQDLAEKVRVLDFGDHIKIERPQDLALLINIRELKGIRGDVLVHLGQLTGLTSLELSANNAADITPLGQLTSLTSLDLSANNAADITPLGQLTGLTSLDLSAINITDITPLGQLKGLTSLTLNADFAADITPLNQLLRLTSLDLSANSAANITAIGQLTGLTSLSLSADFAADITPLGQLNGLTSLYLSAHRAADITPLGQLTGLNSLYLSAHSATDITPLDQLKSLESLHLFTNNAADVSPLGQLTGLTRLSLSANSAADLSPLGQLTGLTSLELWRSKLDLSLLVGMGQLTALTINYARGVDLAPLARLPKLKKLVLWNVTYRNRDKLNGVEIELQNGSKALRSRAKAPPRDQPRD